jgi:tetratricopeptide (TPR) repeat protein
MPKGPITFVLSFLVVSAATICGAQVSKPNATTSATASAEKGASLAESGHCAEALPLLKKSIHLVADKDLKKRMGLDGVRCAMTSNAPYDALAFLQILTPSFARDPEVLYAATHAFSDLSFRASQDLMHEAPFSYQVHELNAEALEVQGKWDEAGAEYRSILKINPFLPGIHARLGRSLLSRPQPSVEQVQEAKKSFESELEIDPKNAGAEYVLGELAKNATDLSAAIRHFTRATNIDSGFTEAYLGLGISLVQAKRFAEAIPPLEAYAKQAPDSPTGHFQLALAYNGAGRKEDANREAALQRQSAENLEQVRRRAAGALEKQVDQSPTAEPPK